MPDWKRILRGQVAKLRLSPAREAEIVEELAQHAEDRYRELLTGGASETEATRIATEEISESDLLASELRTVEHTNAPEPAVWGAGTLSDIRYGLRSLRSSLGLTAVVVGVLGAGIGAAVAMFSLVDAAFLRPLRLPEPERLVQIQQTPKAGGFMPVSYPDFVDWKKQARSFESMAIGGSFPETLKRAGGVERIQVGYLSPEFLPTYGVQPLIGRGFTAEDDQPGAPPVLLLTHRFWQSHFGADRSVVGRTVSIDDRVWTIAGVAAPFEWFRSADVFVPIAFAMNKWGLNMRENHSNTGVTARLKPGVTLQQARAEMTLIAAQIEKAYPGSNGGIGAVVLPLQEYLGGDLRQPVLLMFGAVALLLLVACANVAGLLLARAAVRQREMAIRIALGAGRARLVRQLLTESLLMALLAAGVGLAIAWAGLAGLRGFFPSTEGVGGIGIDLRVALFALLAALATAVLCGLAPALQSTRPDMSAAMKSGGRGSRGGSLKLRTRKLLVVSQVAVAVMLCIGAGLLTRSLLAALDTDPGFRSENVLVVPILPPDRKDADMAHNVQLVRDVAERLTAVAGINAVGATDTLPFSNPESWAQFYRDDRPMPAPGQLPNAMRAVATAEYFRAMGIPLLRGRLFGPSDGQMPRLTRDIPSMLKYLRSTELVTVVNESMARKFWPGEDPIGKTFRFGPPALQGPRVTIVGVVGDTRQLGLDQPVEPQYFFSADQFPVFEWRLVVRSTRDVPGMAAEIRNTVSRLEPDAVVTRIEAMESVVGGRLEGRRNNALLLALFSGLALLLATVGLYATMAYAVAQRTQEIGVRMALGAAASNVRSMVVREGALLACAGLAVGVLGALGATRLVASMLYGIPATDVITFGASALLLGLVMLAASYIPAWRASRVDPMVVLRFE